MEKRKRNPENKIHSRHPFNRGKKNCRNHSLSSVLPKSNTAHFTPECHECNLLVEKLLHLIPEKFPTLLKELQASIPPSPLQNQIQRKTSNYRPMKLKTPKNQSKQQQQTAGIPTITIKSNNTPPTENWITNPTKKMKHKLKKGDIDQLKEQRKKNQKPISNPL